VRRLALVAGLVLAVLLASPGTASAHPLGNFTINLYSSLVVEPGRLRVNYVLDMAEIPTFQESSRFDRNGDGVVTPAEREGYARTKARELASGVVATVDGTRVAVRVVSSSMRFRPGQAGLRILRLEAVFAGHLPGNGTLRYRETNYAGHLGWREITAAGARGEAVAHASVPRRSVSEALLRYPTSLLSDPLEVTSARVSFEPGMSGDAPVLPHGEGGGARPQVSGGAFARLSTWTGLSLPVLLVALMLAAGFGAVHALLPGHGKTIMAAYLVGAGGRIGQAVQVGVAVAFMHTASVLALGFVVLGLTAFAPEQAYPWLTLASGLVVLGLGAALVRARTRRQGADQHDHGHEDHHDREHGHVHGTPDPDRPLSGRGLTGLALAGGILPSPTALVVLLSTVQHHRVPFGLALIGAFSVGLAAALVGVGVLALRAREMVSHRMNGRLWRAIPVASAAVIFGVGLFLVVKAAAQL
jgi:ABC-type nickel/cobalt efflux system permease component RcnA